MAKRKKNTFFKEDDCWESELDTVDGCSKAPEGIEIWIKPLAKVQIDAMMEKFPNIEWFAYLLGDGKDPFTVEKIFVPEQTVTATSVDDIICEDFNKLKPIGAMHSHHGMGTGFSGTDHAFVNQNHNISLVISDTAIAGQVRWKTPCGCLKIVNAEVKPKIEVDFDKAAFLKTEAIKVKEKSYGGANSYMDMNHGGTWVNGVFTANPTGTGQHLSKTQTQHVGGISVKEIAEKAAREKEKNGATNETDESSGSSNGKVTEISSDDVPIEYTTEQSLQSALDEAFPEK